jgi:tRNA threonylcarbamoyladenosine biosynthesis protein TsaE
MTERLQPDLLLTIGTAEEMIALGRELAGLLAAGDLVLLSGELGAGKTTLARGIGAGLGVRGAVTSPTFVLARVHPPETGALPLVHVDAYRLETLAEIEDLDLDTSLADSVTLVEWGDGKAEGLAPDRLHVRIDRPEGADAGDERTVTVRGVGSRWDGEALAALSRWRSA